VGVRGTVWWAGVLLVLGWMGIRGVVNGKRGRCEMKWQRV
jgi:hypothetical protein